MLEDLIFKHFYTYFLFSRQKLFLKTLSSHGLFTSPYLEFSEFENIQQ